MNSVSRVASRGVTRPLTKGGQGNEDFSLACERSERGSRGQSPLAGVQGAEPPEANKF